MNCWSKWPIAFASAVNERSFVARLGGDEFAIIMRPTNGPPTFERAFTRAQITAEAICVEAAFIGNAKVPVEAAFGLALLEPHQDPVSVLSRADMAMYAAKRSGALIREFTPDMEQDNARDLILTTELDAALAAGDIIAHLQPKVSIDTLAIIGVEVLARWNHSVFGLLQPDAFVHLIELSGRIGKFTTRMIGLGLDAAVEARRHGTDLAVAVNVPARGLLDNGFVDSVIAMCAARDLVPSILTVELTEGELMDSAGLGSAVLCDLADAGVRLSIDDFGTGYSSFARLVDLPISEVKIDKSFVQGLDLRTNQVIVRTIVEMGRSLGYQIVAEGVETGAQLDFLRGLGTELSAAQGFAFGRPQPLDALLRASPEPTRADPGALPVRHEVRRPTRCLSVSPMASRRRGRPEIGQELRIGAIEHEPDVDGWCRHHSLLGG